MKCPSCGNEIPEGMTSCPRCGAALNAGAPAPEATPAEAAQPPPAAISLHRSPQLTASLTKFDVFIDGQKVSRIGNNERERYELPPGPHTIYLTIDDFASKRVTIDLRPGENIRLTCWAKPLGLGVVIGFE